MYNILMPNNARVFPALYKTAYCRVVKKDDNESKSEKSNLEEPNQFNWNVMNPRQVQSSIKLIFR